MKKMLLDDKSSVVMNIRQFGAISDSLNSDLNMMFFGHPEMGHP